MPDPPGDLQLSCDHGEDGKVQASWSAPDKAHGLIREYIVSSRSRLGFDPSGVGPEPANAFNSVKKVEYSEEGGLDWTSQRCSATKLEVKDLQSDTLYRFRVRTNTHTHTHL